MQPILRTLLASAACAGILSPAFAADASTGPIKNIVLVHGQFADASGWKPVYDILTQDGYNVSLVQPPETSLPDDVAATQRVLAQQNGPAILVGHSYGGAIITEAGNDAHVAGLVYIAAHMPDDGESTGFNKNKMPGLIKSIKTTADGFLYIDPAHFHADFAADLPAAQAEWMSHAQVMPAAIVNNTPITHAAWHTKPTWYMVAKQDHTINPDLERMYAARAHSHTVEVDGAHTIYISQAKAVAQMIERAAQTAAQ